MKRLFLFLAAACLLALSAALVLSPSLSQSQAQDEPQSPSTRIIGSVFDHQGNAVTNAMVQLSKNPQGELIQQTTTQTDGSFILEVPASAVPKGSTAALFLIVQRAHFKTMRKALDQNQISMLASGEAVVLPQIEMIRQIGPGFWIATFIFILVLILIGIGALHNTLATLVGASLIFAISYLGGAIRPDLYILNFQNALQYIDWNVIFLVMGMMIVIAVVERTGIFQWLAYRAYRISRGRNWLLLLILMSITAVASAFLDNVTTMLLMTPMTIQIALSLAINPLALLLPEVMASNIAGISTLIGTPTNILIGSYAHISFSDFLRVQTPGVVLAIIGLLVFSLIVYRKDLISGNDNEVYGVLLEKLEERGRITHPDHLKKAGVVGAGMLALFIMGERFQLLPSVTALIGATALLVWIRPDIEEMIEAVDWTTLVFFISLFIVVGAVREVGLISLIADAIGRLVGQNLLLAVLSVIWISALLSTVIANIPFTAAMLPVIGFLSHSVPGAESKILFYGLSIGSGMGGNGSLIGASANMVTAGIADRAGYPVTYARFLKRGMPVLFITVGIATLWLVLTYL